MEENLKEKYERQFNDLLEEAGILEEEKVQPEADDAEGKMEDIWEQLNPKIQRALDDMGFEKLTPIQEQAIPVLLTGKDIIGQAQTGTGKTAAFGIPLISRVDPKLQKLQAIVLCPTRELAIQAALELRKLAKYMEGLRVLPVYGGQDIMRQIRNLPGVQIVVGTPGRVMDHMNRHTIKLDDVSMVVLDEADEMLNMGFREDMEVILGAIPNEHQTALFSATMPKPILEITKAFQKDAVNIKIAANELTMPLIDQKYFLVKSKDKDAATVRLLEYYQPRLCLIFCNTKSKVEELAEVLKKNDFQAEGLHGDLIQHQRDIVMGRFRNGSTNILIATDVAARGIDVDNVEIVINYDIPKDNEYYVHRIGRTGRAGKTGQSFTFVGAKEMYRIRDIERYCKTTIEEKKLPDPSKVLKSKAKKYLDMAWELRENEEDIELMKVYLRRKMEKDDCDIFDLAACMLRQEIGEKGEEIPEDKPQPKKGRGEKRSFGKRGDEERGEKRSFGKRGDEERGEKRSFEKREFAKHDEKSFGKRDGEERAERKTGKRADAPYEFWKKDEGKRKKKKEEPTQERIFGRKYERIHTKDRSEFWEKPEAAQKHQDKKEKKSGVKDRKKGKLDAKKVIDVDKLGRPKKVKK